MEQVVINKNDELVMKLLHYFITEAGYSPIVLHGAKDEIWLENFDNGYKIVRIVSNYIHNDEQFDFDLFRTNQIMKQIKKKTFSFEINTLSLFVNLGDNVNIDKYIHSNNIDCAKINKITDLKKYDFIIDTYPTITKGTTFKEKGMNLFFKITEEIGIKNEKEAIQNEEVFKPKKPFITYTLIAINILIWLICISNLEIVKNLCLIPDTNQLYRLITAPFTHYDVVHLAFNMYALYLVGSKLEGFIGHIKYLIVYILSAITGSLLSLTFLENAYSLGASGAIFGLFGSLLYFGYHYRVYLGTMLKSEIVPTLIINIMLGFMIKGIDVAAHIGGLVGGLLSTMALGIKYKSEKIDKINGFILFMIYLLFLIYVAFI